MRAPTPATCRYPLLMKVLVQEASPLLTHLLPLRVPSTLPLTHGLSSIPPLVHHARTNACHVQLLSRQCQLRWAWGAVCCPDVCWACMLSRRSSASCFNLFVSDSALKAAASAFNLLISASWVRLWISACALTRCNSVSCLIREISAAASLAWSSITD